MRRALSVFISLWLLALPLGAQDASSQAADPQPQVRALGHPLTLQEAVALLRARNATLAAGRAHLEAVYNQTITAGLRPNPVFTSANEDFAPGHLTRSYVTTQQEFTDSVSQLIERGHKRAFRVENARLGATVARDNYQESERELEFQLKAAFVNLLLAKANLELAQQNRQDYGETVRLNEVRMQAGEISPTDLDRTRVQAAQFESDLFNAELNVQQARVQLGALLGYGTLPADLDIQGTLAPPNLNLTLADLQRAALANRPDYLATLHGIDKAQSDLRLAYANGATDVIVGSEYKRNGPFDTFGFTVSVPLRIFDRNQGEKLRARNELEASRLAEEAARTQVLADVAQAWAAYQLALGRSRLYSENYLRMAQTVRDRIEFSYRNAGATLLDYLDAVRSYRDVELASHAADAQLLTAVQQLSFATGTEVMP